MAVDVNRSDWHVLTKTENGTVSMIRNLSLRNAVQVYERLDPWAGRVSGQMYSVNGGDVSERHILGPDGWDGCTKGPAHVYPELKVTVTNAGPNEGRSYRSGSCSLCGHHLFEWLDEAGQEQDKGKPGNLG